MAILSNASGSYAPPAHWPHEPLIMPSPTPHPLYAVHLAAPYWSASCRAHDAHEAEKYFGPAQSLFVVTRWLIVAAYIVRCRGRPLRCIRADRTAGRPSLRHHASRSCHAGRCRRRAGRRRLCGGVPSRAAGGTRGSDGDAARGVVNGNVELKLPATDSSTPDLKGRAYVPAARSSTSRRRVISSVRSRGWFPTKNPWSCAMLALTMSPTVS